MSDPGPANEPTRAHPTVDLGRLAEEAVPAPASGERLGRYRVTGRLGEGGMGEVLQVHDDTLDRDVAAKVVRGGGDPLSQAKFVQEAQLTGALDHPNIVPVHELGQTADGRWYFTMQQIAGEPLDAALERRLLPTLAERLGVFGKVCDAIEFAHSRGVIHRDLKPANIMIGRFGEVLVCDWGLAKRIGATEGPASAGPAPGDPRATDPRSTPEGTVMGTPTYMAPEQAAGRTDALDARTDVYALGALLYELLTGVPPFADEDVEAILRRVVSGRLVPPSRAAPGTTVPWELEAVVLKAMDVAPDRRYPTAAALGADVDAFLDRRLLAAASYAPWQRAGRWLHRHRLPLAAAVAVGLATIGALGWGLRARRERQAFVRQAGLATAARARGDWAAARLAARRALDLRPDATLAALAAEADRRVVEETARVARIQATARVAARLRPLAARLAAVRPFRYVPDIDLAPRRAEIAAVAAGVERLLAEPAAAAQAAPWRLLGEARALLGRDALAARALREAHRLDPALPGVAGLLGEIHLRRGLALQLGAGRGRRQAACEAAYAEARRWLSAEPRPADERRLQRAVLVCRLQLARGEREAAGQAAREALAALGNPLGSEALWLIVGISEGGAKAREAFTRALQRCPHDAWTLLLRSTVAETPQARRADLDRALAVDPALGPAYVNRAALRIDQGDLDGAEADLTRALSLDASDALAWTNRAGLRLRRERPREALGDARKAVALDPTRPSGHAVVSRACQQLGLLDEALAAQQRAVALAPGSAARQVGLGVVHTARGEPRKALAAFSEAIELDPRNLTALANRAVTRVALGDHPGALADCDRALILDPRHLGALTNRARIRLLDAQLPELIADTTRLIELAPRAAMYRILRGVARELSGEAELGRDDLRDALRLEPSSPYAALWLAGFDGDPRRLAGTARRNDWLGALARHHLGTEGTPQTVAALEVGPASRRPRRRAQGRAHLGLWAERQGDTAAAIAHYQASLAADAPGSPQVLWSRKRLEALGR